MESDPESVLPLIDRKIEETRQAMNESPRLVGYLARKLTVYEAMRRTQIENLEAGKTPA